MIAWIAIRFGISQILVKIILAAGILGAGALALRYYGNRQWYKGEAKGRVYLSQQLEKQKQAEWASKDKQLAIAINQNAQDSASIAAEKARNERERIAITSNLKSSLALIQSERDSNYANHVVNVPSSMLDGALRDLSSELAGGSPKSIP
jgi:hypothetical protein